MQLNGNFLEIFEKKDNILCKNVKPAKIMHFKYLN